MNIAFRVDASSQIGTGHLMRCLTLADRLKQCGARVRFVSRHMPEYLQEMLAIKQHEFILLNSTPSSTISDSVSHAYWLGTSQYADAQDTVQALSDQTWAWLVVDHYALDARWESLLYKIAENILVIDDIADREHNCDLLLDQNFYQNMNTRYSGKISPNCKLLLGPTYALLRDEFRKFREQVKLNKGPVKRVLIFFGGMDSDNYTTSAIKGLASIGPHGLHVDVVIGAQHPHKQQIKSACTDYGFSCHVQITYMAELIAAADLAIGAGGSAIWERCCLGLPTLTICVADNQHKQIIDAASNGLLYSPELKDDLISSINLHLRALMENACLRDILSRKGMEIVDGYGVSRVIKSLSPSSIEIRIASLEDSQKLFEWRNHPTIRAISRNTEMIDWKNHQRWFVSVLKESDKFLLIGQREGLPVGVVRFDVRDDEAEVSIYLVPGIQKWGEGRDLLQSAEHYFIASRPNVSKIYAHVLAGNERSKRLFLGTGYQLESTTYAKRLH